MGASIQLIRSGYVNRYTELVTNLVTNLKKCDWRAFYSLPDALLIIVSTWDSKTCSDWFKYILSEHTQVSIYIGNHRLPEIQSGNLFEACLISETVQVTNGNFGPFRNGRIGVSVKWRCECEMTKFRQLPNLGSSFSHYSWCEFTGNGRDPYLVGLEGCQIWAPLRGGTWVASTAHDVKAHIPVALG